MIQSLILEENSNYFGDSKPKIKEITFKFYENEEELIFS